MDRFSARGPFDMVGNLYEWVAEWVPKSGGCNHWPRDISPTGDDQCMAGLQPTTAPGALRRGGGFQDGMFAGPLAVDATSEPSASVDGGGGSRIGFRWPLVTLVSARRGRADGQRLLARPAGAVRAPRERAARG